MEHPIVKEFSYNVTIEQLWQVLTDTDMMRTWYFPQLRNFKPVVGYKFLFDDNDAVYQKEWIVTEVVPGKSFSHSWAYKGYAGSSIVSFELISTGDYTNLLLTQTGLNTFPDQPHFRRDRFDRGWDNLLGQNLKVLLESNSPQSFQ